MENLSSYFAFILFATLFKSAISTSSAVSNATIPISSLNLHQNPLFTLSYDPPSGYYSHVKTSLYVHTSFSDILDYNNSKFQLNNNIYIYYAFNGDSPTLSSPHITKDSPYIELNTPIKFGRMRNISLIAVFGDLTTITNTLSSSKTLTFDMIRSSKLQVTKQYNLYYYIEGGFRPSSSAFMIPSPISEGQFVHLKLEMNATVLALQAIGYGIQQFADLYSTQGSSMFYSVFNI